MFQAFKSAVTDSSLAVEKNIETLRLYIDRQALYSGQLWMFMVKTISKCFKYLYMYLLLSLNLLKKSGEGKKNENNQISF